MLQRLLTTKLPNRLYARLVNMASNEISISKEEAGWKITRDGVSLLSPTPKFLAFGSTHFEQKFERHFPVEPTDLAVDVGACIGDTTVPMARKAAKVVAVEPDPTNLHYLRLNTLGWNVEVVAKAAWLYKCDLPFYRHPAPTGHSAVPHSSRKRTVMVDADKLDNFIDHADFLKVDVQGSEAEVLLGAERLLKKVPKIVVETHDRHDPEKRTYPQVVSILEDHGYTVEFEMDNGCAYGWK